MLTRLPPDVPERRPLRPRPGRSWPNRSWQGRFARLAAGLFLLAAPQPALAEVFAPETFTLDNGMTVVVVPNPSSPAISHMVWYRVGAADEPPGQSGIAHFLEHLMFRGTTTHADGEFDRLVSANGGRHNAFTSWDYTAYFQTIAADRLDLVMQLEADRMVNLVLDAELVEAERQVVTEERRERVDNQPGGRLSEQMYAALYLNHPYGVPIIGWEHEIAALTLDEIEAFYRRWYVPNNAVLVVAGDIDAATLRPLAEEIYGAIPAGPLPPRQRPQEPAAMIARSVTLIDDQVEQPAWHRLYHAPSYNMDAADAHALQILDEILGSGTTSRLYRSLVLDQAIATGAGSGYRASAVDASIFSVSVSPKPDVGPETVAQSVDAEIDRLLTDGITQAELDQARDRLLLATAYAQDSLYWPTRVFGQALATGGDIDQVERWPERLAAVTVDDVMAAAARVFDRDRSVTGVLLPAEDPRS